MKPTPDHEKLFDEICGKLNELSYKGENMSSEGWTERIEKMHSQLKKTQDELIAAQQDLQNKIGTFDSMNTQNHDMNPEIEKLAKQLEAERTQNSKISSDLAKSLELNLKLQFEIEEIRTKANQVLSEEKKHNQYLIDKNKNLNHEIELAQAHNQDIKSELSKAREKFQSDLNQWNQDKITFSKQIEDFKKLVEESSNESKELRKQLDTKDEELKTISDSLLEFENHSQQQNQIMKDLSSVAEKKIVELKIALDKKSLEAKDYYSHLQQSLSQVAILKKENSALKDYITKITALHNQSQITNTSTPIAPIEPTTVQ